MERTLLFVPGDRPDRFDKAAAAGADLVVLDLEDAVGPAAKDEARAHVAAWLGARPADAPPAAVRVNAIDGPEHRADVEALAGHAGPVMVAKAEDPAAIGSLSARLAPGASLLLLVETATGVLAAPGLAGATGVARLVLGAFDLAAELGVSPDDREALLGARHALVLASAAAGLAPPVDGVSGDVTDEARLRDDVAYAVRLGFGGKLCVHPRQVGPAAEGLRPGAEELAWARRVVDAAGGEAVALVDGRMVDKPVLDRARRILEG